MCNSRKKNNYKPVQGMEPMKLRDALLYLDKTCDIELGVFSACEGRIYLIKDYARNYVRGLTAKELVKFVEKEIEIENNERI